MEEDGIRELAHERGHEEEEEEITTLGTSSHLNC